MPSPREAEAEPGRKPQTTPQTQQAAETGNTPTISAADNTAGARAGGALQDAIAALKDDHRRVEALFAEHEQAPAGRKARIVKQICQELVIHTVLEEEIFYPACREAASDEDPLDEAQVEHDSAKVLIADLMKGGRGDRYRDAKVSVLAEQIRHHVAEEEKPSEGIFAKAQSAGVNTPELAQRLQTRKQDLQAKSNELPAPQPVSFQTAKRPEASMEEKMARQGDGNRDERGRFTDNDDRGGRGYGRSSRDDDDRNYRSRNRDDDDDGRGWYGDSRGHADAARRGWEERGGESRSFSRGRDDDDRGGREDRERDDRGRFMSDDDDRGYRSRGHDDDDRGSRGGGDRDRDERGRFARDDDDRGYRSRNRDDDDDRRGGRGGGNRDRDDRGRFASDDDRRSSARSRDDDDDDRGGRGQGGWFGDPRGHAEAARRGWEERSGGSARTRSRDDDDDRRRSRSSRDDDDGRGSRGQGGWFGDSRGHAEAARRGWEDRR